MPLPILAAAVSAGGNLASQAINSITQSKLNKSQQRYNTYMYDRQRADNLADYNMQNEYNSPAAQMQRLKDAKLNPNLVYGNGSATNDAAPVRSASPGSWNPTAPRLDLGGAANAGLSAFYDAQLKEQTTDNLKAQNDVLVQDAMLKAAQLGYVNSQTMNTLQNTKGSQFDLSMKQSLADGQLQLQQLSLDKLKADTQNVLSDIETKTLMREPNLQKAIEDILTARASRSTSAAQRDQIYQTIDNMKKEGVLKDLDIQLRRMGINPNDPMYMRMIGRLVNAVSDSPVTKKVAQVGTDFIDFFRRTLPLP